MKKILQCTMALDIGGAETHVVELSKELTRRGYTVTVASNGGVYENELSEANVTHVRIPMHSKHPKYIIASLVQLHRTIKTFKPDIVHAHARIPALYVSFLSRLHHFKMITTAHGKFKINFVLKWITQWGKDIYVVSDDIKNYLLENYTVEDSTIYSTVNGIDTHRFTPRASADDVQSIVHVSRLDQETSLTAELLIAYAKQYTQPIKIVGDGTEFKRLKLLAKDLNHVTFTGATREVQKELCSNAIFVGISRSALEAMSMNLPSILCGDYGFMGVMTPDLVDLAKSNNFTARVPEKPTLEKLIAAIQWAKKQPRETFQWQRPFIETHYSVHKMVDDYLVAYEDKPDKKIFIIGYYGSNNLGDELLLQETIQLCERYTQRSSIEALSYHVSKTVEMHGIKGVGRNKFFSILKAIKKCDVVVGGGGSMLQNVTSNRSLIYYLALIQIASYYQKKILILGNGIGPIKGNLQSKWVERTLSKVDYLHLRDKNSYDWVMRFRTSSVDSGADLAFLKKDYEKVAPSKKITLNIRKWKGVDTMTPNLSEALEKLRTSGYAIGFLSMQTGNDDVALSPLGHPSNYETILELINDLASSKIVIAMRLHTLILCATLRIPFIGIAYDPKVSYLCQEMGMPYFKNVESVTSDQLLAWVNHIETQYEAYVLKLDERATHLESLNAPMSVALDKFL